MRITCSTKRPIGSPLSPPHALFSGAIPNPDLPTPAVCTAIITTRYRNGDPAGALHLFRTMRSDGLPPNRYVLPTILSACGAERERELGLQVHALAVRAGLDANPFVRSALVSMYSRCSDLPAAKLAVDSATPGDSASWNALIVSCSRGGFHSRTLNLFVEMHQRGFTLDEFAYPSALNSAALMCHVDTGRAVHSMLLKSGFEGHLHVGNALVDMYAKCGDLNCARGVFDRMPVRDVIGWTSLLTASSGYVSSEDALHLFLEMRSAGVDLDAYSMARLLSSCAELTVLELGRQLHATITKRGFDSFLSVGNAILSMYAKHGCIDEAALCFEIMKSRDRITWTALIVAYAQNGRGLDSVRVYDEMIRSGFEPDYITFIGLLFGCSHVGLVETGWSYFESMDSIHRVPPGPEHYVCMIDLLGRSGRFDELVQLLNRMRVEPDAAVWKAVLSACRVHWKSAPAVDLAERAAEILFRVSPDDAVPYVLLSNIYSRIGRWSDVSKLRALMKDRRVRKEPGRSWIEVGGVMHAFHVEECGHERTMEIYAKVEEMMGTIRRMGYVADKESASHEEGEYGKEMGLAHHSEKLAVAFGLLCLPRGVVVRVYKNLRICGDCHVALKFVSRAYGRSIVIRDPNRFHHINDGVCSCGDYW